MMNRKFFKERTRRERSKKSEDRAARKYGGRRQPASGALSGLKGDVVTPKYLIEDKTTQQKGFRITPGLWRKIADEAVRADRSPMLRITFEQEHLTLVIKAEHND